MEAFLTILLVAIGGVGFIALTIAVYGAIGAYVLSTLWAWFAVPLLGMPPLTMAQVWGLSLIASWFLTKTHNNGQKIDKERYLEVFLTPFVSAFFFLLFGWILKHYI